MRLRNLLLTTATTAGLLVATTSDADVVTLVNDTFDIPSGAATRGDDAADANDTAWYSIGSFMAGSPSVEPNTGGDLSFSSDTLVVNAAADNQSIAARFDTVTLANIGDSITLSLSMRFPNGRTKGGGFSIGLFNDAGTAITADNDGTVTPTSDDSGYILNVGVPDTGTTGGTSSFRKNVAGMYGVHTTLGSGVGSGMRGGSSSQEKTIADLSMTIERTGASELTLTGNFTNATVTSVLPFTRTDTEDLVTSFNEIGINWAWGQQYRIDDVVVSTNVPEPASMALVGAGLLMLGWRPRRAG